jgi:hypothetical protein
MKPPAKKKKKLRWTKKKDLKTGKVEKCKIYDERHF